MAPMNESALVFYIRQSYAVLVKVASGLQSPLLLAVRLYWGWQFFLAGKGKLLHLDKTTEFFTSLNLPLPKLNAILAGTTECIGGLLLLAGFASRLTAIPLIVTMSVAYATAHREELQAILSEPEKFLTASPFQFLFAALLILAFGPGAFSLDRILSRKFADPADAYRRS